MQQLLTVVAINLVRLSDWWAGMPLTWMLGLGRLRPGGEEEFQFGDLAVEVLEQVEVHREGAVDALCAPAACCARRVGLTDPSTGPQLSLQYRGIVSRNEGQRLTVSR